MALRPPPPNIILLNTLIITNTHRYSLQPCILTVKVAGAINISHFGGVGSLLLVESGLRPPLDIVRLEMVAIIYGDHYLTVNTVHGCLLVYIEVGTSIIGNLKHKKIMTVN